MKTISFKLVVFFTLLFGLSSCGDKCFYYVNETVHEDVLMNLDEIKTSFVVTEDYDIGKPGNIYTYGKYLLVAEKFKGIHILDNSNPANPIKLKFIGLKGNENFIIKNNYIIADNGPDILSIDFSNLNDIKIVDRQVNVNTSKIRGNQFIVGQNVSIQKVKKECDNNNSGIFLSQSSSDASSASAVGQGGSMSKFASLGNFLYIVNNSELIPVEISNPAKPITNPKLKLTSENVETLFPYKKYLYMGTSNGILIYNTEGSENSPRYISTISHVFGCDPVIVSDDVAFSTIRGGTSCRNVSVNELNLYNVFNPSNSYFLRSFGMEEPYGLGIKDDLLFICQGFKGLFVYDYDKSTNNISLRHSYPDIHAFDVIVNGNTLIITADNGLFQFDISNKDNLVYQSKLVAF